MIWRVLGAAVDLFHALAMVAWVAGLPLLFWHGRPRLTRWYGLFALTFVAVLLTSQALLGECVLTTASRALWERASPEGGQASSEWFTVRLAEAVFNMTPSHRAIKRVSEVLVAFCAAGALLSLRRTWREAPPRGPRPGLGGPGWGRRTI